MPTQSKFNKHFRTLGLPKTATEQDVRDARKRLALSYHPDKAGAEEIEDTHEYMSKVNEAYDVLMKVCFPVRSLLKRRRSGDEDDEKDDDDDAGGGGHTTTTPSDQDLPHATKRSKFQQREPDHADKNTDIEIDVAQIRIDFSEMKKARLLKHFVLTGLDESELGLREKDSKIDNVIFATVQKVRQLLRDGGWHAADDLELEREVERRCRSGLVVEWARRGKMLCQEELVRWHGYDAVRISKWTLWQLVNEVVKEKSQPSPMGVPRPQPIPMYMHATSSNPEMSQQTPYHTSNQDDNLNPYPTQEPNQCATFTTAQQPPTLPIHPRSHPSLPPTSTYSLADPSNPSSTPLTTRQQQQALQLSFATTLTLPAAESLLAQHDDDYAGALSQFVRLERADDPALQHEGVLLSRRDALVMRLARATGLTAEWAARCLEAFGWVYEDALTFFVEQERRGAIADECLVPSSGARSKRVR